VARIFISYRRDEAVAYAGWLAEKLGDHFGQNQIFRDIGSIEPGIDFMEAIQRELDTCEVMLVLIGRTWLTVTDITGRQRLRDPEDYVRLEIAAGLAQSSTRVVPVLLQGALMPRMDELPDNLARLAHRNACELRDTSWDIDLKQLIAFLERVLSTVEVPDLTGQRGPAARRTLTAVGLKLGDHTKVPNDEVSEGKIVKQYPAAETKAKQGSYVNITFSGGPRIPPAKPDFLPGEQNPKLDRFQSLLSRIRNLLKMKGS
jgi:hypothetical protein